MDTALNSLLKNPDKPSLWLCFKHDSWQRRASSKEKPKTSGGPSYPQCIIPTSFKWISHQKLPFHLKKLQKYKIHYIICVCETTCLILCLSAACHQTAPTRPTHHDCPGTLPSSSLDHLGSSGGQTNIHTAWLLNKYCNF